MVVNRAFALALLFSCLLAAGCGSGRKGAESSFIDDYLGLRGGKVKVEVSKSNPLPALKGSGALDREVETHPEKIAEIVLPKGYYTPRVLSNKLRIAASYLSRGDYTSARRELLDFLRKRPEDAEASFMLAVAFHGLEDTEREEKMLVRTLELEPSHPLANYNYGCLLLAKGDELGALARFDACLAEAPGFAAALYNKALIAMRWKRYDAAVKLLTVAARSAPADARVMNNLGVACELSGRPERAEFCYLKALSLDPACAEAADNLCSFYLSRGKYAEARRYARLLQKLEGGSPYLTWRLARAAVLAGDLTEAASRLQAALAEDPSLAARTLAEPDFAPLLAANPGLEEALSR